MTEKLEFLRKTQFLTKSIFFIQKQIIVDTSKSLN